MAVSQQGASKAALDKLSRRVSALEHTVAEQGSELNAVKELAQKAVDCSQLAAENTTELLAITTAAKGTAAFVSKHWPRFVAFATGLMAAAGIGNPKINSFLAAFFS